MEKMVRDDRYDITILMCLNQNSTYLVDSMI